MGEMKISLFLCVTIVAMLVCGGLSMATKKEEMPGNMIQEMAQILADIPMEDIPLDQIEKLMEQFIVREDRSVQTDKRSMDHCYTRKDICLKFRCPGPQCSLCRVEFANCLRSN